MDEVLSPERRPCAHDPNYFRTSEWVDLEWVVIATGGCVLGIQTVMQRMHRIISQIVWRQLPPSAADICAVDDCLIRDRGLQRRETAMAKHEWLDVRSACACEHLTKRTAPGHAPPP